MELLVISIFPVAGLVFYSKNLIYSILAIACTNLTQHYPWQDACLIALGYLVYSWWLSIAQARQNFELVILVSSLCLCLMFPWIVLLKSLRLIYIGVCMIVPRLIPTTSLLSCDQVNDGVMWRLSGRDERSERIWCCPVDESQTITVDQPERYASLPFDDQATDPVRTGPGCLVSVWWWPLSYPPHVVNLALLYTPSSVGGQQRHP